MDRFKKKGACRPKLARGYKGQAGSTLNSQMLEKDYIAGREPK